ncbi:MAG: hypothetical protein ACRDRL_27760 [Sciscionella sp.]
MIDLNLLEQTLDLRRCPSRRTQRPRSIRLQRRIGQGCLTVEMEAVSLLALTRYRKVRFGQVLLAADSLAGPAWNDRDWMSAREARQLLFWTAAQAATEM